MAGFQVKIWYVSGAYEEIDDAPVETATAVYAEAEDNERVYAGEIHGSGSHALFESFCHGRVDSVTDVG